MKKILLIFILSLLGKGVNLKSNTPENKGSISSLKHEVHFPKIKSIQEVKLFTSINLNMMKVSIPQKKSMLNILSKPFKLSFKVSKHFLVVLSYSS